MLITAEHLCFERDGKLILADVNFAIAAGEIVTVIGPNGGGKTTFARLCLGILSPTSGRIARQPGLRVGYVPQRLHIEKSLPLKVARFLSLRNLRGPMGGLRKSATASSGRSPLKEDLHETLALVGAGHLIEAQMGTLSGGEMQRVLLARAILQKPDLLVLDEPAQGVDFAGEAALYKLIGALREKLHCAILLISHDLHIVMGQSDRVLCLNRHICCEGVPEQISQHPEYANLFGADMAAQLGLYAHHHDHEHQLCGGVHEGACGEDHTPQRRCTEGGELPADQDAEDEALTDGDGEHAQPGKVRDGVSADG